MTNDPSVIVVRPRAEFDRNEFISVKGWTQLQGEVLEQLALMHGDDHLPPMMLRENANESRELRDVNFVHRLDRIIQDKTRHDRFHREMERNEQRQRRGVQIAGTQHHLW